MLSLGTVNIEMGEVKTPKSQFERWKNLRVISEPTLSGRTTWLRNLNSAGVCVCDKKQVQWFDVIFLPEKPIQCLCHSVGSRIERVISRFYWEYWNWTLPSLKIEGTNVFWRVVMVDGGSWMGSVSEKEVQSVIRDVDVLKNHMERVSFTNVCMFVTLSQLTPSQSLLQNTPDTMSKSH